MLDELIVAKSTTSELCQRESVPISLNIKGQGTVRLSPRWLRLACECDICGDSRSGMRWITPADVPVDIRYRSIESTADDTVTITWGDGHRSHYDVDLLLRHGDRDGKVEGMGRYRPELWDSRLSEHLSRFSFDQVLVDDQSLFTSLKALRDHGIMMLTGVPSTPEDTLKIAARYGPVRETSYGKVFDLISKPDARVAGETSRAQIPHTDEPFRYTPPGFIFFHAIKVGAGSGGTSLMVDGFHIAETMRSKTPDLFEILTRRGVTFQREHAGEVFFSAEAHVISLDMAGAVTGVRFNDRSLAPQIADLKEIEGILDALAEFTTLACEPANQFHHQLQPGEMLVFDNHRILHGRTTFDPSVAVRHLRSCNIDRDAVHSAFRTLARRFAPAEAATVLYQGAIL